MVGNLVDLFSEDVRVNTGVTIRKSVLDNFDAIIGEDISRSRAIERVLEAGMRDAKEAGGYDDRRK